MSININKKNIKEIEINFDSILELIKSHLNGKDPIIIFGIHTERKNDKKDLWLSKEDLEIRLLNIGLKLTS
jgi:hypothetical protein